MVWDIDEQFYQRIIFLKKYKGFHGENHRNSKKFKENHEADTRGVNLWFSE